MIRAQLTDGTYVRVAPKGLDLLLNHGMLKRFLRSSGWAEVGVDPIRSCSQAASYTGADRRRPTG